ncbi:60S acidic ribosomal protein P1 [Borealophlyctis nickersoniae]|nr:60S acidic ribosomal protein P1 [Borealophlyctis nickersoniae]
MSALSTSEAACVYAALILHDDGVEITVSGWVDEWGMGGRMEGMEGTGDMAASGKCGMVHCGRDGSKASEKLTALIDAAGVEIEPIWTSLFAKALAGKDIGSFLFNVGSGGGGGAAAPAAGGAAAGGAAAAEEKKEEKEEVKEESDDDMGFGLFD